MEPLDNPPDGPPNPDDGGDGPGPNPAGPPGPELPQDPDDPDKAGGGGEGEGPPPRPDGPPTVPGGVVPPIPGDIPGDGNGVPNGPLPNGLLPNGMVPQVPGDGSGYGQPPWQQWQYYNQRGVFPVPNMPGASPYIPGVTGQYPSLPSGGIGCQPRSDGPRLPYGTPSSGGIPTGSAPNSGVSNNANLIHMVNDCMSKLTSALQGLPTDQPRGLNAGASGVWSQPANQSAGGPDMNGPYLGVNNTHVVGAFGGNPDVNIGYGMGVAAHGRQGGRNPYTPGTMMHKMRAIGVPTRTIDMALEGEYVELADFLAPIGSSSHIANPELEAVMDSNNSVTYRPKKYTRKISNHETWSSGWNNYEKLMVAYFGSNLHEYMSDYRTFIMESSKKYVWQAVSVYDFRHRTRLATMVSLSDRLNFRATFNDTNNTVLDTTAIRPNAPRCIRCKAYDHLIQDCPFPDTKIEIQKKSQSQSQEICPNFNKDKCVLERCRRRHVCQRCKGPLSYAKCQVSGTCSGRSGLPIVA